MVTRLAPEARSLFKTAEAQARGSGSPLIEAEHLLLAMCARPDTDAGQVLVSFGLTPAALQEALDQEFVASLAAAGVFVSTGSLGRPSPRPRRHLRLSASSKAAMERAVTAAAGSGRIRPGHLLLGVLGTRVGTVPRALHFAGVDQAEITARTEQALAA